MMRVQLESLKATTDTKEVSFKIAYGLPLSEMLRWGLYISGAACFAAHTFAYYSFPVPILFALQASQAPRC